MGELVSLEEYKEKVIRNEIADLTMELEMIMSFWPEEEACGYFLSLEETNHIENKWLSKQRLK
jgi:hypothetical protein